MHAWACYSFVIIELWGSIIKLQWVIVFRAWRPKCVVPWVSKLVDGDNRRFRRYSVNCITGIWKSRAGFLNSLDSAHDCCKCWNKFLPSDHNCYRFLPIRVRSFARNEFVFDSEAVCGPGAVDSQLIAGNDPGHNTAVAGMVRRNLHRAPRHCCLGNR